MKAYEMCHEKTGLQGFDRSGSNWTVQSETMARILKIKI